MDRVIGEVLKYSRGSDIIVDARANVGIFSILLAITLTKRNIDTDIVAFEPAKKLRASFQYNQSLYRQEIKNRICLENIAITTPIITLDDYQFEDKRISVIKMDIADYNLPALQGMQKTLHQYKPVILFISLYHPVKKFLGPSNISQQTKTDPQNTVDNFFHDIGYRVEKIGRIAYAAYPI